MEVEILKKNLTPVQLAYIAGIIDGEGCISISKRNVKKSKRGVYYQPKIAVANTNKDLIDWLVNTTQLGSVTYRRGKTSKHKDSWMWTLWTVPSRHLLPLIRPYLVCKQKQADVLIEFMMKIENCGKRGLTDEEWLQKEAAYSQIRMLNKKGVT